MTGDQPEQDGTLLASRLRDLPNVSRQFSCVRTDKGWQANCLIDGGWRVYVHEDPVCALLVAVGAVHVHDMHARSQPGLTAEDMELLG